MLVALRSFIRPLWIGRIAVVPVIAAVSFFVQSTAGPLVPASFAAPAAAASSDGGCAASEGLLTQAKPESAGREPQPAQAAGAAGAPPSQVTAHEAGQAPCPPSAQMDIPLDSTIETTLKGMLDSERLKAGKEVWVRVLYPLSYPGCTLLTGSALYGHVTAAVAQKSPGASELALAFDHADCEGQERKQMPLRLIAVVGPDASAKVHDAMPAGLHGESRNTAATGKAINFVDDSLNPGGPPHTVHVGIVVGLPKLKLDYTGGPGCSSRITSTDRSVQLEPGSEFILVVQSTP
jgi:hypothetical protein